jgi:hypothetical protein
MACSISLRRDNGKDSTSAAASAYGSSAGLLVVDGLHSRGLFPMAGDAADGGICCCSLIGC